MLGSVDTRTLAKLVDEESYADAHALIDASPVESERDTAGVTAAHRLVWLAEGKDEEASVPAESDGSSLPFERAYALYRLKKFDSLHDLDESSDRRLRILSAMVANRRGLYPDAAERYSAVLSDRSGPFSGIEDALWELHVRVNLSGALLCAGRAREARLVEDVDRSALHAEEVADAWDLLYQRACAAADEGSMVEAVKGLSSAAKLAAEEGEGVDAEAKLQRAALLHRLLWRTEASAEAAMIARGMEDAALSAVARNNDTAARRDRKDVVDALRRTTEALTKDAENPKLTPGQVLALRANKCVLLLALGKASEAESEAADLEKDCPLAATPALIRASVAANKAAGCPWPYRHGDKRRDEGEDRTRLAIAACDAAAPDLQEWTLQAWATMEEAGSKVTAAATGMLTHGAAGTLQSLSAQEGGTGSADGGVVATALALAQLYCDAGKWKEAASTLRPRADGGLLPPDAAAAAPVLWVRWELATAARGDEEEGGGEAGKELVSSTSIAYVSTTADEALRFWDSKAKDERDPIAPASARAVLHGRSLWELRSQQFDAATSSANAWLDRTEAGSTEHLAALALLADIQTAASLATISSSSSSTPPSSSAVVAFEEAAGKDALGWEEALRAADAAIVDAAAAPTRRVPRRKSRSASAGSGGGGEAGGGEESGKEKDAAPAIATGAAPKMVRANARSVEARRRRRQRRADKFRAKLRIRYNLDDDDELIAPKPERWIPKSERTRRGRRGAASGGAQGAKVDERTAAALDARAREEARKGGAVPVAEAPSTASIEATTTIPTRKGGKGGKRKKRR